jgi:hypothetical protein
VLWDTTRLRAEHDAVMPQHATLANGIDRHLGRLERENSLAPALRIAP